MERIEEIISLINSQEKKETQNIFFKYLKRWPWFIVFCFIGVSSGFLLYRYSPDIYQAKSRILIKKDDYSLNSSVLSFNNPVLNMREKTNIKNQLGILQSYTLYRKALNNLNRQTTWYRKELLYNAEMYNNSPFELLVPPIAKNTQNILLEIVALNKNEFSIKADGETAQNGYLQPVNFERVIKFGTPFVNEFFNFTLNFGKGKIGEKYLLRFNSLDVMTKQYLKNTNIALEDLTSDLISITVEGNVIQKEVDFINELNTVFIEFGMAEENLNSENSVKFIDSQLLRIKESLNQAENKYSSYRKNNQVMNLGQEAQMVYTKLEQIEQEQYLTQLQIDYYIELQSYLDNSSRMEEIVSPSVIGIKDDNLNKMLSNLLNLYRRREVLSYSVQDKNPSLILLEKEIKVTRDGLEETLKNQLKSTESKMESINGRYKTIESRLKKLPDTEKKLIGIQREFDLNNELYTYMLQKKAEASISKASIVSKISIIDEAFVESAIKVGPSLVKNVGVGFIGGFIIPFIFITLLSFFNTKIETREEVENKSNIPVLDGIIQHKYKIKLPVIYHPRSGIAESFRGVKSNLNAILKGTGSKVVSINSLIPGEGKSFISSNLSAILAKTDTKVLLIGADLHKPTLHNFLEVEESFGLSNYFNNEKSFEEIISSTIVPNLHFIQAGPIPENPSDLIDNVKFENLVYLARKIFDYIIIDNAPLLLVPDAILTSRFSDVSLFILRMNYSHKEQVRQINKIVDLNKIQQAAIVINEAPNLGYGYGRKYWKKGYGEYKYKMS